MNHPDSFSPPFRLHAWLVQPDLNRISGEQGPVQIEPRVMAVLLALAARPGAVVSRLELLDTVWGDAVVGEEILTRAISELRRVFGDDARQPAYIETIRHNGYRLIAPVLPAPAPVPEPRGVPETAAPPPVPPPLGSPPLGSPPLVPPRRGSWLRLLVLAAVLAGLAAAVALWPAQRQEAPGPRTLAAVPLTTFAGREYHPALSADGLRVAFAWSGPDGTTTAIHLKQRNSEATLQLSDEPGWAAWPAWSPDGQTIAFVQTAAAASAICLVPSLGGAVRRLHTVDHLIEGLDWSPDGRQLVFSARDTVRGEYGLYLMDLASLRVSALAATRPDNAGDLQPRFAPDGGRVAWIGLNRTGGAGIFLADLTDLADLAGRETRMVLSSQDDLQGLAWRPDGRHLVYAAAAAGVYNLWQVPAGGGAPARLETPEEFAWNPAIARLSGDLVYEQVRVDQDLARVRITDRLSWQVETTPFAASTRWEFEADFRPGGGGVALVSARGGNPEIWLCDAAGQNLQKLTSWGATAITNLRWSPDGGQLACNAVVAGEHRILVTDPAGSPARRLTTGQPLEVFGAWNGAGDALLVGANPGQGWQVFRLPLTGGAPVQVTRSGGVIAQADAAGTTLYYTRPDRPGLWRLQSGGRVEPELLLPDLSPRDRFNWRLTPDHLYWVTRVGGTALLMEYGLVTGQAQLLVELPGLQGSGLGVDPAQDVYVYPRLGEAAGDLMLVAAPGLVP